MTPIPDPCPAPFNLAAHVLARAAEFGDKTALEVVSGDGIERWSFGALEAAVRGTASGLLARGLSPGERVLIRLGNSVDFPVLYLACLAVDLVPVPTSAQLTAPEITAISAALRPALVVAAPGVPLPDAPDVPVLSLDDLRRLRTGPPAPYAMGDPDRPGYIVFTSGTSGTARGVVHAHRAIWARRSMIDGWYGLRADDRLMHAGAFNWTYTLGTGLMDPWAAGATALIPAPGTPTADLARLIAARRVSIFAAAPGVYRQMLRHPIPPVPALRHGLSAGEKLPRAVAEAWSAATGTEIFEAYGMSECSTFISGAPDRPAAPGTLGRAQPERRVAILGPEGPVPQGDPGIIAIAADDPGLMLGYLDDPATTAARVRDGWFLTGDMGRMDASGAIGFLGRADDMMNAGGYRVSPLEVEAALTGFPGLSEIAVTEIEVRPDVTVIAAFYTSDTPLDGAALDAYAADRLARYKCPRSFHRLDSLPKGANGKILRAALRRTTRV